jgi:hypothetical protein
MTRLLQHPSLGGEIPSALRENAWTPSAGATERTPTIRTDAVYVFYTTVEETFTAIRVANDFAAALGVPVTVLHLRSVPYALPVDRPSGISPLETEEFLERLRREGLNVRVRVYLCRDERRALPFAVEPHSLVVVAGHHGWWPTRSQRTRRMMEAAGHFVMFVDTSEYRPAARDASSPLRAA